MKTAIYLRVSTIGVKGNHIQSTDSQRLEIENYLKSKGVTDYQVYEDLGISGKKRDRPELNRMIKNCQDGKISQVVIYKLDRLARSLKDLMEITTMFKELKIAFVSVKDSLDMSTATGMLMFNILGSFAEFEAATIRERVLSGLASARSKGVKLGRKKKEAHSVVCELKNSGMTVIEIANHTGLSRKSVYDTLNKNKTVE